MQEYRAGWPTSCTQSLITENGKNLYYDTKPGPWGTMGIGIYTDVKCIQEIPRLNFHPRDIGGTSSSQSKARGRR